MTTLTEQQRSKSIRGKKKKNARASKIALCSPFTKYWPRLNEDGAKEVEKLLTNVIIPKKLKLHRNCFIFGLNAVSRAIQHSRVNSCLLADNVQPEMIVQHLVTLAMTRGIPVLILPKLKEISCKTIGFSCIAMGIIVEKNSCSKQLQEKILQLSSMFPLPPNYAWFFRGNKKVNEKVTVNRRLVSADKPENVRSTNTGSTSSFQATDNSSFGFSVANEHNISGDFIPFSKEKDPMQIVKERSRINFLSYLPPSYKFVPKNPNKIKKKLF